MKVAFYDTHKYEKSFFQEANKTYNFKIDYFEFKLTPETSLTCWGYDAVCVFVNDILDSEVIKNLSDGGIKLIVLRCAGYNNVDIEQAHKYNITVVRVPGYSPHAIAEHTIALILSLSRKIPQAFIRTKSGNFSLEGLMGFTLYGKTAGIFGMNIMLNDIYPDTKWAVQSGFNYYDTKDIFANSDIISLHCPLTPQTRHIINKGSLAKMKKDTFIVNTSRGALIDTPALVQSLKQKQLAGAALDVYEEENNYFFNDWSNEIISDDTLIRLMTFPNVIITSHQAFLTQEAIIAIAHTTLYNIHCYQSGKTLENIVF